MLEHTLQTVLLSYLWYCGNEYYQLYLVESMPRKEVRKIRHCPLLRSPRAWHCFEIVVAISIQVGQTDKPSTRLSLTVHRVWIRNIKMCTLKSAEPFSDDR